MSSIYDVPYEDVKSFLQANNVSFSNGNDSYNKALILLNDKKAIGHTISIIEWILAHNLLINKIVIPNYSLDEIDNMSQGQIDKLSKLLGMKRNNRDNIKHILKYLDKLDDEIQLLPEINNIILDLSNELIIKDLMSSNFYEIIELFLNYSDKRFLRTFLYDNMEDIIDNVNKNILGITMTNIYDTEKLMNFIIDLLGIDEIGLAKKALNVIIDKNIKLYNYNSVQEFLLLNVINVNDTVRNTLLERYFKFLNDDDLLEETYSSIENIFSEARSVRQKFIDIIKKLHIPFIKIAIKLNKYKIITEIIRYWENYIKEYFKNIGELENYFDYAEIEELNLLVKEMEDLIKKGQDLIDYQLT